VACVVHPSLRRAGRWLSPTTLVLAGLCFLLPFVTVACDAPGGYGRAAPGGTTTYSGIDLVLGAAPAVAPPDKVRPAAQARDDRVGPAPAAAVALLLIVAGIGFAIRVGEPRVRRGSVAALAGVAATALMVNQALVQSELAVRVAEQLTQPIPPNKAVRDFIHTGQGFALCFLLLLLVAVVNAVGWWRTRPRPALVSEPVP
jgi:ABC-type branched-subunit amino acid transport system permease subunit